MWQKGAKDRRGERGCRIRVVGCGWMVSSACGCRHCVDGGAWDEDEGEVRVR